MIKAYKTLPTYHHSMYSDFKDVTFSLVTFVMMIIMLMAAVQATSDVTDNTKSPDVCHVTDKACKNRSGCCCKTEYNVPHDRKHQKKSRKVHKSQTEKASQ